jgi:LuxR family maltose regulon positive regulatory protein
VAWITLDPADDDPLRLWTYVATAVDRIRPGIGQPALRRLRGAGASVDEAVDELLNGLLAYGRPAVIVLDDLHVLADQECLKSLEHAVDRLPENVRVVATTRVDPGLRLARLRGRGSLGEIRSSELAFTVEEARSVLVDGERLALDDGDLALLVDRTEGWPAGLYLAALWLRGIDHPSSGVREFAKGNRHVTDYLSAEVLQVLPPERKSFLLRTAVLGRFNAALADAVLERDDSAAVIAEIEHSNLFLVALDPRGDWFRYHHLFEALLELELTNEDPTEARRIHRRAHAWCREHGLPEEALVHAAAAGDWHGVADTLGEHHLTLLRSGPATLLRWAEALPPDALLDHPELAGAGAVAAVVLRRSTERRRLVAVAERARERNGDGWTPYAEFAFNLARAAVIDDDIGRGVERARRALALAGESGDETVVGALAVLAQALELAGQFVEARDVAREAVARPEAHARPHGFAAALAVLALAELETGQPEVAEAHARQAQAFVHEAGLRETVGAALSHMALASVLARTGRLREAEREATKAERLFRQADPDAPHTRALLVLAEIRARRGQVRRAGDDLERARRQTAELTDAGVLPGLIERVEQAIGDAAARMPARVEQPSDAELAVLRLLASDLSQREIGARLYVSLNTVKTHTRGLYRKLGVNSRDEAVARAATLGLLEPGEVGG